MDTSGGAAYRQGSSCPLDTRRRADSPAAAATLGTQFAVEVTNGEDPVLMLGAP
jgi:hypothetical protein